MAEERLAEIRKLRLQRREALLAAGRTPYPAEVRRSHELAHIVREFDALLQEQTPLTVVGRVSSIRRHGGVVFLDVVDGSGQLQLKVGRDDVAADFFTQLEQLDSGDFIQAAGRPMRTERGVATLAVREWHIISKSIRPLPSTWYGLKDHETRFRQREVDMLLNPIVKETLVLRSRVMAWLRHYLTEQGYLEVETPILQLQAGGAAAAPFTTHHNTLDLPLYLRIAPELYLKRLLVGGLEKVFELGRNFRNEGIDREHNPEFTMLELYWAYADYEDLMELTESLFTALLTEIVGGVQLPRGDTTIDFTIPLRRERYVDLVSQVIGIDILKDKTPAAYLALFAERGLEPPEATTYPKLIDELYKTLVRPTLVQPVLLYDYPAELVPLAKRNASDPSIAEKFQLVVGGTELVNAYTELNDPVEQRQRFEEQQRSRAAGDIEAHPLDESYLRALEYGMPPAAGWGLGIDRLVALLCNAPTLRETIAFPLLKPDHD